MAARIAYCEEHTHTEIIGLFCKRALQKRRYSAKLRIVKRYPLQLLIICDDAQMGGIDDIHVARADCWAAISL